MLQKGVETLKSQVSCFNMGSILIKPVQRILKYPLILNELVLDDLLVRLVAALTALAVQPLQHIVDNLPEDVICLVAVLTTLIAQQLSQLAVVQNTAWCAMCACTLRTQPPAQGHIVQPRSAPEACMGLVFGCALETQPWRVCVFALNVNANWTRKLPCRQDASITTV